MRGKTLEQREKERPEHGNWIIPPELYNPLNKEFNFKFDPCPNPKPKKFNGLEVDWKKSNWVNPPFWAGITYWVRKAIAEQQKGNTSVLILPLDNWVKLLFDAQAEVRVVGTHDWIHTRDGSRKKSPRPSFLFILRPKKCKNLIPTGIPPNIHSCCKPCSELELCEECSQFQSKEKRLISKKSINKFFDK